ncbi:MAG: hypothetical protein HY566_03710 [Candidatus Kerfeldbacteria bacterium]|nr:hypothetical protein [Candidatus Kerfeldbacteria bacterium]
MRKNGKRRHQKPHSKPKARTTKKRKGSKCLTAARREVRRRHAFHVAAPLADRFGEEPIPVPRTIAGGGEGEEHEMPRVEVQISVPMTASSGAERDVIERRGEGEDAGLDRVEDTFPSDE